MPERRGKGEVFIM